MPTYDYICDACAHEFEAFESIKADPQSICPACSKSTLRRKIGPGAAILFKGSGFYQTDYRSDSYKKGAEADKSSGPSASANSGTSSGSGDGGSSAKSESKPAAPAASTPPSSGS
ncbi:MAG: FmdB family zinc ribbon protein [Isosphaeraceae bacterium]|nr:FmdB family zinc ribbon protein [Isosphaeraceae bacterium]